MKLIVTFTLSNTQAMEQLLVVISESTMIKLIQMQDRLILQFQQMAGGILSSHGKMDVSGVITFTLSDTQAMEQH